MEAHVSLSPDGEEVALTFEVTTGEDGRSFTLNVESEEELSYDEFLSAIAKFLEAEEVSPSHH